MGTAPAETSFGDVPICRGFREMGTVHLAYGWFGTVPISRGTRQINRRFRAERVTASSAARRIEAP